MEILFTVAGDPVPQPRPRVSTRGGFGRAYTPTKHPVHVFRKSIALAAVSAGAEPVDHPVTVAIDAVFARPKSHRNKKGLKPSAPRLPRQDVDNIAKAVLDALNGVAWVDDSQVRQISVTKDWGDEGRTCVRIN